MNYDEFDIIIPSKRDRRDKTKTLKPIIACFLFYLYLLAVNLHI